MTNSMNPDTQPQQQQLVIENIDKYLADGRPVYDKNGDKVGDVKMYSTAAGYLMVGTGAFGRTDLYIPFRLIRSIDPRDIFLTETKDTLQAQYTQPPTVTTINETRLVPGPRGTITPQTQQVQMVQSGYDTRMVPASQVNTQQMAQQLVLGMAVYDAMGKRIGDLTQYDIPRGLLVVEQGIFTPRVLLVPFGVIKKVDRDTLTVQLAMAEDTILQQHAMMPTDTPARPG